MPCPYHKRGLQRHPWGPMLATYRFNYGPSEARRLATGPRSRATRAATNGVLHMSREMAQHPNEASGEHAEPHLFGPASPQTLAADLADDFERSIRGYILGR